MKNYNQSKARSLSDFLRKMSINGRIFEVDLSSVFKFNNEINAIGNNLNQIAKNKYLWLYRRRWYWFY